MTTKASDNQCRVAALYVDVEAGPYASMPGVDCWGVDRDARLYNGPHPVIAHPPCNGWGSLRMCRRSFQRQHIWDSGRYDRDAIAMSCGPAAVEQVRKYGGVLEHPASSFLWRYAALPVPNGFADDFGGVTVEFDQGHYGHPCPKRTWLYAVGVDLFGVFRAGPSKALGRVTQQSSTARHITPGPLARLLVELAKSVNVSVPS